MAEAAPSFIDWLTPDSLRELSDALGEPATQSSLRSKAFEAFQSLPLEPNPLYRKYGYFAGVDLSGIAPQARGRPVPETPPVAGRLQILHDASGTRVRMPPGLESEGVTVTPFVDALSAPVEGAVPFMRGLDQPTDRLSALALAVLNRGYRLTVPSHCPIPVLVEDITVLSEPHEALSVHRSVLAGAESQLLIAEQAFSAPTAEQGQRLVASSIDLDLGPGCQAVHLGLHAPDPHAVAVYQRRATVGDRARIGWVWGGFGGFRTRSRNSTDLVGNGSSVEDLQAFFGTEHQAYDSSVYLTHIGTDTRGHSMTRGVFRDEARGMSRGLVRIEREARKTVSVLSEHAMLLSRKARSDTIPILEILCRDVKATHSTSVAPVDPEKVFYLESRGISTEDSIRMIAEGFLAHVLERAPLLQLRELIQPILAERWENRVPWWDPQHLPALPPLALGGGAADTEWRFDTKLR